MRNIVRGHLATCLALLAGLHAWPVCALAADGQTGDSLPELPRYADVRTDVEVKNIEKIEWQSPRPENFYQLAGARDHQLCGKVLAAFNERGQYSGEGDRVRWLLDNSHQVEFQRLPSAVPYYDRPDSALYVFPGLEYARVDIDGDGDDEHVYRLNAVLSSQWHQRLMIVPDELQSHPELLAAPTELCQKGKPREGCDHPTTRIRHAVTARAPDRLPNEWAFTSRNIWSATTRDADSRRLIYRSRNQMQRNIGSASSAYWSLYALDGAVVAVAAPIHAFAPPELLVFVPDQHVTGSLQCVLMPVAWPE